MLDINDTGNKITIRWMAELLGVSQRTVHRNMSKELKHEKQILNEKL
jgi:DeoR/GlpR family transcriptional regulator of sugar metabolism